MKIRILGHDFEIEYKNHVDRGANNEGMVFHWENKIEIQDELMAKSKQEEILLHEIIEAINRMLGLELEHKQIIALSSGLYQVCSDNPELRLGNKGGE